MILFEKFGQHQPLNRQVERYAREGVPISLSTMADAVGLSCAALKPVLKLLEAHVMAAERLHGDDTTVPVLAEGKTDTERCWVYVRDDRPFAGTSPPAAMFYYSRDRKSMHPQSHLAGYAGVFQADAFDGYRPLYLPERSPGAIVEAGIAGRTPDGRSLPWPTLRRTPGAKRPAKRRSHSRRWPSRSCVASMPCSRSSDRSMARAQQTARRLARNGASR